MTIILHIVLCPHLLHHLECTRLLETHLSVHIHLPPPPSPPSPNSHPPPYSYNPAPASYSTSHCTSSPLLIIPLLNQLPLPIQRLHPTYHHLNPILQHLHLHLFQPHADQQQQPYYPAPPPSSYYPRPPSTQWAKLSIHLNLLPHNNQILIQLMIQAIQPLHPPLTKRPAQDTIHQPTRGNQTLTLPTNSNSSSESSYYTSSPTSQDRNPQYNSTYPTRTDPTYDSYSTSPTSQPAYQGASSSNNPSTYPNQEAYPQNNSSTSLTEGANPSYNSSAYLTPLNPNPTKASPPFSPTNVSSTNRNKQQ